MWLAYTMNGVVYNEDGTLNEESVTEALKYMETLIQEELVDPADKTSSGMDAYITNLTGGSASFLTGPTSVCIQKHKIQRSAVVVGQIDTNPYTGKRRKIRK